MVRQQDVRFLAAEGATAPSPDVLDATARSATVPETLHGEFRSQLISLCKAHSIDVVPQEARARPLSLRRGGKHGSALKLKKGQSSNAASQQRRRLMAIGLNTAAGLPEHRAPQDHTFLAPVDDVTGAMDLPLLREEPPPPPTMASFTEFRRSSRVLPGDLRSARHFGAPGRGSRRSSAASPPPPELFGDFTFLPENTHLTPDELRDIIAARAADAAAGPPPSESVTRLVGVVRDRRHDAASRAAATTRSCYIRPRAEPASPDQAQKKVRRAATPPATRRVPRTDMVFADPAPRASRAGLDRRLSYVAPAPQPRSHDLGAPMRTADGARTLQAQRAVRPVVNTYSASHRAAMRRGECGVSVSADLAAGLASAATGEFAIDEDDFGTEGFVVAGTFAVAFDEDELPEAS
jgi:hypothetical protein